MSIVKDLHKRFTYKVDPKKIFDEWSVPKGHLFTGDCDNFMLKLAYELAGKSYLKMWFDFITLKSVPWYVTSYKGNPHIVLWHRGEGWADNMEPDWYSTKDMRHKKRFPFLFPMVAIKMTLSKLVH